MDAKVYESIAKITEEMAQAGISKDRKNKDQGYAFRGIDDVYNALSPLLAKHNLCILPNALEREVVERHSQRGNSLFFVTVKVRFDFVCALDGSKHEVVMYGEGMDTSDKATNKAMSAAYKYAVIETFCIPTQGESSDADFETPEVLPGEAKQKAPAKKSSDPLLKSASEASCKGTELYTEFWSGLTPAQQKTIGEQRHADFWAVAQEADREAA